MYQFGEKDIRLCSGPTGIELSKPINFAANEVDGILVNLHCRFSHKLGYCTCSDESPKAKCPNDGAALE